MSTDSARPAVGQRLLVDNVDWRDYTRLLRVFAEHPSFRLAYDRGRLEIVSPLPEQEMDVDFLGVLVRSLTRELGLTIQGGGSMTMRRRRKQKGIEPDRCYWIANEPAVRGKLTFDPRIDPPPIWPSRSMLPAVRSIVWAFMPRWASRKSGGSISQR